MTAVTPTTFTATEANCLIAGEPEPGAERVDVINPGNLADRVGSAPKLSVEHVDRAVRAAARAQQGWAAQPAVQRAAAVVRAVAAIGAIPHLAETLSREQGKTITEARGEVAILRHFAAYYAEKAPLLDQARLRTDRADMNVRIRSEPLGVVAIITPFNWPLALTVTRVAPALIAGNSVVVKPAPTTPLAVLTAVAAMAEHLLPGVLSVLTGDNDVPEALTKHPLVGMVSFTGSTKTGGKVAANAVASIKKIELELGGNDAAIFLDDADLAGDVLAKVVQSAFTTAGQVCHAVKRIYVPRDLVGDVAAGLGQILDGYRIGLGLDPTTDMGPVHSRRQLERVQSFVAEAQAKGSLAVHGTLTVDPSTGWYMLPVIAVGLDESAALVSEEQFGPALPVIAYDHVEEAIARANNTSYGLTGSVWGQDVERATAVAKRLQVGLSCVNMHGFTGDMDTPFGGVKRSGIGKTGGWEGLASFTNQQSLAVAAPDRGPSADN